MTRHSVLPLILCAVLLTGGTQAIAITLLHEFAAGDSDGSGPFAGVAVSGSTLYGTTELGGGVNDLGTVFSMNTDGSNFTLLHSFGGLPDDGARPRAVLTQSGSTLYGTTQSGVGNVGTIFSIETDGSGFTLLHEFSGGADGRGPVAGLTLSGSTLYGTTEAGSPNDGTVFSIETDGSGFTLLHEFFGGASDGSAPVAGLTLSGSTLYGTTKAGGDNGLGTIFSIETDGSNFTLLHEFTPTGFLNYPQAGLTLSGSTLYGTTILGGVNAGGTIFSIGTDGSDFTVLHEFAGGAGDGYWPFADMTLSGSTLIGTTWFGGINDLGTVFSMNTDGSDFTLLHEFAGNPNDGSKALPGVTLSGSTLYGATLEGGIRNRGTVFSLEVPALVPEPGSLRLVFLGGLVAAAAYGLRRFVRQPCR